MFTIMVVEDDKGARMLMKDVLTDAGYRVVTAKDGVEALDTLDHVQVDLIVLDVMMPNMDGMTFTRELRDAGSELPILMVTALETRDDIKKGLRAGADDYMTKPVDEDEMLLRIKALLRRARIAQERRIEVGSTCLEYDSFTVRCGSVQQDMPPKEFLLLFKLLGTPDHIFTRRQLMDEIWGMDTESDERTVNVHINRLREKFRDNPDFEIVTVRGLGYKAVKKC